MMNSFQTILDSIDKHHQSLEWTTDSGTVLHGVLHQKDGRLILNINPKGLSKAVQFEYLYHVNNLGGRRVLYPYDVRSSKYIPSGRESEVWPIEIFICEDEVGYSDPKFEKTTRFTFDSFLWYRVPETNKEKRQHDRLISNVQNIETSLGKISFSLYGEESFSTHPSRLEKTMDKIAISVTRDDPFTNEQLLMWHARFSQLLTFINKERVVTRAIERGLSKSLVPALVEDYTPASYAYRESVGLKEFVDFIKNTITNFVDNYDELASFSEDLIVYYRDYPLDPPDKIQLLRLFTSIEQCANYAQKKEAILSKKLTKEQSSREKEFNTLLTEIKHNKKIPTSVKEYLKSTAKKFYTTSGSQAAPKHKIVGLANLLQKKYGFFTSMSNMTNVELSLKMRHVVAHGFYDPTTEKKFYENRDRLGQDIERCLRAYILRALGAKPRIVKRHSEPLKARQFNSY